MSGMDIGGTPESETTATSDASMGAMAMSMEGPIASEGVPLATETEGSQPLEFQLNGDVKVFELTAKPVRWQILKEVLVTAWTHIGTVPGPMIRVTEGDQVRVISKNDLPKATSSHWHGLSAPNNIDGVASFTQPAIEPGETFTYEFTAERAGTFLYHSQVATDTQIPIGLYALLIIEPKTSEVDPPAIDEMLMLREWAISPDGQTNPSLPMVGAEPNNFTVNGKALPDTQQVTAKVGQKVRLRLAAIGQFTHPMHLHGASFRIVAADGNPVPEAAQLAKNTVAVNPGEQCDIEFTFDKPGTWVLRCHVLHHVTSNDVEPGGLIHVINVEP